MKSDLFLVSIRDGDQEVLLGACASEREALDMMASHATKRFEREQARAYVHDEDEIRARIAEILRTMMASSRIERVC